MKKIINLSNKRFGELKVLRLGSIKKTNKGRNLYHYVCECSCGNIKEILGWNISSGKSKSCGCTDGFLPEEHRMTKSREYRVWSKMKNRCLNPNNKRFKDYGGRGITVCVEWRHSFKTFYKDMGNRPENKTLDRIDNNKGYSKENCRWATNKEQSSNMRSNHFLEYNGETKTVSEWARLYGFKEGVLSSRIYRGWSIERAITQPVKHKHKHNRSL
jgi:hypothetical protein